MIKAVIINEYGGPGVLQYSDIEIPPLQPGEVRIRTIASSINPIDFKIRRGDLKLIVRKKFPIVLGHDIAGVVEELGSAHGSFSLGQKVYGMNSAPAMGAYASQVSLDEDKLATAPESIPLEEAAVIPLAGLTALQALRDHGMLRKGQQVLINGASGGVGTFAVQIAKIMGAEVTGVCSGRNTETVKKMGADTVIDYTHQSIEKLPNQYDLVFDAVGKSSYLRCRSILKKSGHYVTTLPGPSAFLWSWLTKFSHQSAHTMWVKSNRNDLEILRNYVDNEGLRPLIEKTYNYDQFADAMRHAESDRTIGKLLIRLNFPDTDQG